jgi:hypothetical protein
MRIVLPILAAVAVVALAQQKQDVILAQNFEDGTEGWSAMGPEAELQFVRAGGPNRDAGAVRLSYGLGTGRFAAAGLPVLGKLAQMRRIRFQIKSDHDTAIAMIFGEEKPGGGDYMASFWVWADAWQQIELTPADFSPNNGPNDPVDQDGKLDLDRVQGIGIVDLACIFSAMPDSPNIPIVVSRPKGQHSLSLAGFQILSDILNNQGPEGRADGPAQVIDAFDRGFLQWITLGGMALQLSTNGNPLGIPALEAAYEQTEGRFALLQRRLANFNLSAAKRLSFDIASERDTVLMVSLELSQPRASDGPRYNLTIFPPADRKPFHVNLLLSDFERDVNSPTPGPARLDPSRLKSFTITDVTSASGGETGANTIWIGNLQVLPE